MNINLQKPTNNIFTLNSFYDLKFIFIEKYISQFFTGKNIHCIVLYSILVIIIRIYKI